MFLDDFNSRHFSTFKDMSKEQIIEKLSQKLSIVLSSESDVVYILSRIRKILEQQSKDDRKKYCCLNFYCNLALHSKIERLPKSTKEMLLKIKDGELNPSAYQNSILGYQDFHKQLIDFLKEFGLPSNIYNEKYGVKKFNQLLNDIYSDTPIILTNKQKIEVTIDKNGGISFKVFTNK